jgi:hypothetical protein
MHNSRPTPAGVRSGVSILRLNVGLASLLPLLLPSSFAQSAIPLPEHPRPNFERADWLNLNGTWSFRFDPTDGGAAAAWSAGEATFPQSIVVPFPWGSPLSGVENQADIGWYRRAVTVPEAWQGKRIFLVVGACDWLTQGWLDGHALGEHRGGYTPFEFELTPHVRWGQEQRLVLRVDDSPHPFKLEGKQGYGAAKGIWQTVYLEARTAVYLDTLHFTPDIDRSRVTVKATLSDPVSGALRIDFKTGNQAQAAHALDESQREVTFEIPMADHRLWSLEDPFLYEVQATLVVGGDTMDRVNSYFGMRKISVLDLPGTDYPYIALNNRPIYLQIALDQSYHPEGFYTFPSDAFMRDEILRSRRLGLNANRFHVKIDVPRKIYWSDRLGVLVMADVPNSWGEPDAEMRRETEYALRQMIRRDYNSPSIFAWVPFNETWGLFTKQGDQRVFLPETQEWVASVYRLAKTLDPSRLVEDNSPCNYDHVETDINSWHAYLPGWEWKSHLEQVTRDTRPGSTWNFIGGREQARQPLLNSECGNVWGYEGSTGDVDWSWDYHIMMNEFRRHPKVCGWLYTEHHDVINEWNGYYRFDRSEKFTGLEELAPGMTLADLHRPFYVSTGSELCRDVEPGETVHVPLFLSCLTDRAPGRQLVLRTELVGWDALGHFATYGHGSRKLAEFTPWLARELTPALEVQAPDQPCLAILRLTLETESGAVLHRNFTTFRVTSGAAPRVERLERDGAELLVVRFAPHSFRDSEWSLKQWNILDGLKVNGAGHGYFEYHLRWPEGLDPKQVAAATFMLEASAKRLHGKDQPDAGTQEGDFMRGRGTHDPSLNPNSYPMTDTVPFPSAVRILVSGQGVAVRDLPDDPADHRGILSWHAQLRDRRLREAGSYGYLVSVTIPADLLETAAEAREIVVRLEVDAATAGGLAIYGEDFGRYPIDPTLIFTLK